MMCLDMVNVLDNDLIPYAASSRSKVFYYNLKGDYFRYLAEVYSGDLRKSAADSCRESYMAGLELAKKEVCT